MKSQDKDIIFLKHYFLPYTVLFLQICSLLTILKSVIAKIICSLVILVVE